MKEKEWCIALDNVSPYTDPVLGLRYIFLKGERATKEKVFSMIPSMTEEEYARYFRPATEEEINGEFEWDGYQYILKKQHSWSEEDEYLYTWCMSAIQTRYDDGLFTGNEYQQTSLWLQSLKDRVQPQPKQEWSEEDEQHIDSLLKRLEGLCKNEFERTRFAISEDEDWLKSIKDRYTWKPSDRQMKAIEHICDGNYNVDLDILDSIYKDFKKLREE